jgi:hypothetical protein
MYKYKQEKKKKNQKNQHQENRRRSSGHVENAPTPRTLPASNDLHKPRSTLNKAGKANGDPHALTKGGHSLTRTGHVPRKKEPHGSVE